MMGVNYPKKFGGSEGRKGGGEEGGISPHILTNKFNFALIKAYQLFSREENFVATLLLIMPLIVF